MGMYRKLATFLYRYNKFITGIYLAFTANSQLG